MRIKRSICKFVGIISLIYVGYLLDGIVLGYDSSTIYLDEFKSLFIFIIIFINVFIDFVRFGEIKK